MPNPPPRPTAESRSVARRVGSVAVFCLVAFLATLVSQSVWTGLLVANLKTSPGIPWSVAVMAVLLWAMWRYAGGAWWPNSTRQSRAWYRRANPVASDLFLRAMLAGLLSLGALISLWLALGHLVHIPGNPAANYAGYSLLTVVAVIVMASLVGAVTEEVGLRGYMLTRLERSVGGWLAVAIVALAISPGHGATQGFAVVTLAWYLLSDLLLGALSLLTRSILPSIAVHAVGLRILLGGLAHRPFPASSSARLAGAGVLDRSCRVRHPAGLRTRRAPESRCAHTEIRRISLF